ncbi:hypothetical protein SISSUDRAFT_1056879 [Sistotremastrum suecicum HHB10207 ss-3]|uniref:Dilute domain-containing protein n=1 Tax=Sistotremastrum suecicum HHB10207 ss-3 TaxID=1314776 RepID=A0A166JAI1_9AGAM|nr:hypothetical protein SISSUDRAFT_1056879 [Sistotremastrum suecicum HHB10207 ss-3]
MVPQTIDLTPKPDLQPIYPTPSQVSVLISPSSSLTPAEKRAFVAHCLHRACIFGDLALLSYLLADPHVRPFVDLDVQDEDGFGPVTTIIMGFGSDSDREVEREECIRLLVAEGADINHKDLAGWTPLHHASLLSPPTLISFLVMQGASTLQRTNRNLTPVDVIRGYSTIPGREDIVSLLEESMREEGWKGGRLELNRQEEERITKRNKTRKDIREYVTRVLELPDGWWGNDAGVTSDESDSSDDEDDYLDDYDVQNTPPRNWTSILAFSPHSLPQILKTLIVDVQPSLQNMEPARGLYLCTRFACLWGNADWVEDLVVGGVDKIEEVVYAHPEDLSCLTFWLSNCTILLHLLRCDQDVAESIDVLGLFTLIEELINAIQVFIIRIVERRIDPLIDTCLLDHTPLSTEFDSVQFESEWSFFGSLTSKKKKTSPGTPSPFIRSPPQTPQRTNFNVHNPPSRPSSPPASLVSPSSARFSSLRQSISRAKGETLPGTPALQNFLDQISSQSPASNPRDITAVLTALHTLLCLSGVNPAMIVQAFSQIMYWTACEMFNRILTRKKYLCRSRAIQIGMNIGVIEEWVGTVELPKGIESHFSPVKELLHWLQCLSSITDFPDLVATVQMMRNLNPFQMRRAVRDYKYEVSENRMPEECSQYLAQLQKDWERHRVKVGVETLRKELDERDRDHDDSFSDSAMDSQSVAGYAASTSTNTLDSDTGNLQEAIDLLFDRNYEKSEWLPPKPPPVLGELLESRYMLPLLLPSDPVMLCALPRKLDPPKQRVSPLGTLRASTPDGERSASRVSQRTRNAMVYRLRPRRVRVTSLRTLKFVDGTYRWPQHGDEDMSLPNPDPGIEHSPPNSPRFTAIQRQPSTSRKAIRRTSSGFVESEPGP